MVQKNDPSGKHKKSNDKSVVDKSLKMQKQGYDKFFKDVCSLINEFNKKKGKVEKVLK